MTIKKNAQLSIFVIVGIVILFMLGAFLYFGTYSSLKKSQRAALSVQRKAFDIQPIKKYVNECLAKTARDGLITLGKQGGYIYKSQGGTLLDYYGAESFTGSSDEGKFFLRWEDNIISYAIYPPRYQIGIYSSSVPIYPWATFPYSDTSLSSMTADGYFGLDRIPSLERSHGAHSMQEQLESYITNNLRKCIDLGVFEEKGFALEEKGDPEVNAVIADRDTAFNLKYPISIKWAETGEKTELNEFSVQYNVRLKRMHNMMSYIVQNDISDISFDVDKLGQQEGFAISVLNDITINGVKSNDDIIILKDTRALIQGKPFEISFGRHNRAPGLFYSLPKKTEFKTGETVTRDVIFQTESALDPDEDVVKFSYEPEFPYTFQSVDAAYKKKVFRQTASDGMLEDYQEVVAEVTD